MRWTTVGLAALLMLGSLPLLGCGGTFQTGEVRAGPADDTNQGRIATLTADNTRLSTEATMVALADGNARLAATATAQAVPPTPVPTRAVTATPLPPTAAPSPVAVAAPTAAAPRTVTTTLESGWKLHTRAADGFAIELPPSWTVLDLDAQTLDAGLRANSNLNPQMAALMGSQGRQLLAQGGKLYGADLSPEAIGSGLPANINVIKQTLPADFALDFVVQGSVAALENLPVIVKPVSHRRLTTQAGPVEEIRSRINMTIAGPAGPTPRLVANVQYIVLKAREQYVVTLGSLDDQSEQYGPVFEKIGTSFRWAP